MFRKFYSTPGHPKEAGRIGYLQNRRDHNPSAKRSQEEVTLGKNLKINSYDTKDILEAEPERGKVPLAESLERRREFPPPDKSMVSLKGFLPELRIERC